MHDAEALPRLTFDEVNKYTSYVALRQHGPRLPIQDHRLAAGILFRRRGQFRKFLLTPRLYESFICDNEYGYGSFSIQIAPEVVEKLRGLRALEGLSSWGYNSRIQQLSHIGRKLVVTEWFTPELYDIGVAGGTIDLAAGAVRWNQD